MSVAMLPTYSSPHILARQQPPKAHGAERTAKTKKHKKNLSLLYRILLIFCGLLTACAQPSLNVPIGTVADVNEERETQYEQLFHALVDSKEYGEEMRVMNVTYPLLRAGAEMCSDNLTYDYGFMLYDPEAFGANGGGSFWFPDAGYTVNEGIRVLFAADDFPARNAGITSESLITQIGDTSLSGMSTTEIKETLSYYREQQKPLTLTYRNEEQLRTATLEPVAMCDYPAIIKRSSELNAYADGTNIYVTASMLKFVKNDDELAMVMGHEISHNILTHSNKRMGNMAIGLLADALLVGTTGVNSHGFFAKMGGISYSKNFESEADYLGIYLMARAGYATQGIGDFWRRMGVEAPESIAGRFVSTHPSSPERYVVIKQTIAEIAEKRKQQQALLPNHL